MTLAFAPGEVAQVDWWEYGKIAFGNTRCRLSFFAMVLARRRQLVAGEVARRDGALIRRRFRAARLPGVKTLDGFPLPSPSRRNPLSECICHTTLRANLRSAPTIVAITTLAPCRAFHPRTGHPLRIRAGVPRLSYHARLVRPG